MAQRPKIAPNSPSPPPGEDSASTRILNIATDVAGRLGYRELTVARVVAQAGVGRTTFYEHFADIGSCFLLAVDRIVDALLSEVGLAAAQRRSGSRTVTVMEPVLALARDNEPAARCLLVESLGAGAAALDRRDRFCAETARQLATTWSDGGELRPGALRAAVSLVGGTIRLLAMRLGDGAFGVDPDLAEGIGSWVGSYVAKGGPEPWAPLARLERRAGPVDSAFANRTPALLPPGRHTLSRNEVASHQRERILAAVAELSLSRSYGSLTVADITAAANVSRNVFYAQFRDRTEAATEANERFFERGMAAAAGAFFAEREWPERVRAAGRVLLDFLAAHPANAHLGFVEPHAIGPAAVQLSYERLGAFTLFLEEGYRQVPEDRQPSRVTSDALAAVMFEVVYRELRKTGGVAELPTRLPGLAYVILAPFIGTEEARRFVERKAAPRQAAEGGSVPSA